MKEEPTSQPDDNHTSAEEGRQQHPLPQRAHVADRFERNRRNLGQLGWLSPNEKEADVAQDPVGKVNNACRKMETLRLQIVAPPLKNFRRLATQRRRPIWVRRIHSAAAIAAQLAR